MLVKICGISNIIDAFTAIEYGASAIGFVMGGKVLPPEVEPHAQTVREIIKGFPPDVDSFLVTHLFDPIEITLLAEYINCSGIQLSENIGVESVKSVRERTSKKIIKTVVANQAVGLQQLQLYEPFCDFILLDSQIGGYVGGTGHTSDWVVCKTLVDAATKPVYLAGGLKPENVVAAIQSVAPDGVDVSTGISTYGDNYLRKDRKDPARIRQFISLARAPQKLLSQSSVSA